MSAPKCKVCRSELLPLEAIGALLAREIARAVENLRSCEVEEARAEASLSSLRSCAPRELLPDALVCAWSRRARAIHDREVAEIELRQARLRAIYSRLQRLREPKLDLVQVSQQLLFGDAR